MSFEMIKYLKAIRVCRKYSKERLPEEIRILEEVFFGELGWIVIVI